METFNRTELRHDIIREIKAALTEDRKPVFIYDRVSTKQQEVTGTSLQQQEEKGVKYASDNNLHIAHFFTTAESAYKAGRKIFNLMLDLALETGVKDIVFMCTDRMSRNFNDWSRLKSLIDEHNFNIHFYQEGSVIHRKSHHSEKFVMNIKLAVAEGHSDKVSHDSKQTAIWKVKHGICPGGTPAYGYSYDSSRRLFVKNDNAALVMKIFDLYDNEDYTTEGIIEYLNGQGYKTQKGNDWNRTTVLRVLSGIFYTGRFEYEGNIYHGTHEPYITEERYYERCDKMKLKYRGMRKRKNDFILKGLLRSGDSGNMLTGELKKERFTYYTHRRPVYTAFKEEDVFKLIDDKMRFIRFSTGFEEHLRELFRESVEVNEKGQAKDQESVRKEILKLEKEQQKLLQLLIDGVDEKAVRMRMDENKKVIARLENRHQQMRINKTDFILEVSKVIEKVRDVFELYQMADIAEKGRLIRILAKTVHVWDDQVSIDWKMPYSFILDERVLQIANSQGMPASSEIERDGSTTGAHSNSNLRELVFRELSPAWQAHYLRSA
jgi:site-specific DNA recombinase